LIFQVKSNSGISQLLNKRVMITGHTGFKGSWLTFILKGLGCEVLGYSLPDLNHQSHFNQLSIRDSITHIDGDIRDRDFLASTMQAFNPDIVFHLAANAIVSSCYADPTECFDTNVMGSVNVLEACNSTPSVQAVIYVTSDKCYENVEWVWGYRENDRLGGYDPYSASKACAEIVFSSYLRSFFAKNPDIGVASVRAGNVIGGGDWALNRIVPDCMRSLFDGRDIILRNPKATRPWQHVLEPLSGYMHLAAKLLTEPKKYSGSWNFGPNASETRSVEDLATYFVKYFGRGVVKRHQDPSQPKEANILKLNCDKAHEMLNWKPKWTVDQTLEFTASWYKEYHTGKAVTSITQKQVQEYFG
jgi:CDP-glucose 4,6-dehydratase